MNAMLDDAVKDWHGDWTRAAKRVHDLVFEIKHAKFVGQEISILKPIVFFGPCHWYEHVFIDDIGQDAGPAGSSFSR